jgi:hypothetical protein
MGYLVEPCINAKEKAIMLKMGYLDVQNGILGGVRLNAKEKAIMLKIVHCTCLLQIINRHVRAEQIGC